ncbi:hypothetical protein HMI54_015714 [Coelomomyces lativittatus]|nr:hypothetical protein HMI56_004715 [Coelomomyces lativittatus]KAJ1510136.1 hypothetical protein HMI55_007109 [Coelomomyces lativittatus]KAJ1512425.1 hypothetical protein HMI54_015714 [Coelomomyces lativittatus]
METMNPTAIADERTNSELPNNDKATVNENNPEVPPLSSLTIPIRINPSHSGLVTESSTLSSNSTLTPFATSTTTPPSNGLDPLTVFGIVSGVFTVFLLLLCIFIYLRTKKHKRTHRWSMLRTPTWKRKKRLDSKDQNTRATSPPPPFSMTYPTETFEDTSGMVPEPFVLNEEIMCPSFPTFSRDEEDIVPLEIRTDLKASKDRLSISSMSSGIIFANSPKK